MKSTTKTCDMKMPGGVCPKERAHAGPCTGPTPICRCNVGKEYLSRYGANKQCPQTVSKEGRKCVPCAHGNHEHNPPVRCPRCSDMVRELDADYEGKRSYCGPCATIVRGDD